MRRGLFAVLYLGLGLIGLVAIVLWFQYARRTWITTQNAEVWAPTYAVSSPVAGRITAWSSRLQGTQVRAGAVLGTIETATGPVTLRSAHAGRLVGDFGYPGALVQAGQEIALVADMRRSYVLAYVEESRAASLRLGERADIYPASSPGHTLSARIAKIYPAVASITWPLPPLPSGSFSPTAQWVPVRLRLGQRGRLYLGGTVTVGIWIGGGSGE